MGRQYVFDDIHVGLYVYTLFTLILPDLLDLLAPVDLTHPHTTFHHLDCFCSLCW